MAGPLCITHIVRTLELELGVVSKQKKKLELGLEVFSESKN